MIPMGLKIASGDPRHTERHALVVRIRSELGTASAVWN